MAVFLVGSVAICDLCFFLLRLRTRSGFRSVALQTFVPWPVLVALGYAIRPLTGIPLHHAVVLGFLIPSLVAIGAFTIDHLEEDLGIDRSRLAPGRGEVLNSLKSFLYSAPIVFHYLRYFSDAF
jgi:predicted CDP-diglyceride synthetase/phosphatidate cytidylyltransferase